MKEATSRRLKRWRLPLALIALIPGLWLVMALTGTPHEPYRVPGGAIETSIAELVEGSKDYLAQVEGSCVETHLNRGSERFKVAFVEFDDQGAFWKRRQLEILEQELQAAADSEDHEGVLIVTFVHGWQHNASVCDQNVSCFRDMLESLVNVENFRANALREQGIDTAAKPRYVFGVYVGWRGLANPIPVLREMTFYNRKATAHRVGRGDVLELFTRLEVWRDKLREEEYGDTKLVILGHSFGGAVTYEALSKVLHERLARAVAANDGRPAPAAPLRGFGDLIVLVNPAFEASLYSGIYALAREFSEYSEEQPVTLITVSSDTDSATHLAFPAGRFFATRFLKTRDRQQADSLTTTIGNFEPYRTHRLEGPCPPSETGSGSSRACLSKEDLAGGVLTLADLATGRDVEVARGASDCKCDYFAAEMKDAGTEDPYGDFQLSPARGIFGETKLTAKNGVTANTPFITATTTEAVVSNHNGIYNKLFLNFLRSFLLEMDHRTRTASVQESPQKAGDAGQEESIEGRSTP